jgi:DNA polymerase/3'-5' exonuclease PolX
MELKRAREIAEKLVEKLAPYCERIEIAGSIRREKAEVKDIEIVAIPKDELDFILPSLLPEARFIKNGARYKQILLSAARSGYEEINLDLFLVRPPAQWGVIFTLRTGPARFSKSIVTRRREGGLLPSDCQVANGQIWRNGKSIPMPEEEDFLRLTGMAGKGPKERG